MVSNIGAPYFVSPLEDIVIQVPNMKAYRLPNTVDPDGDSVTIKVNSGTAFEFIIWNQPYLTVISSEENKGIYNIKITLKDSNAIPLT